MQENRSFDHYFGSYKGVRGFNDHSATSLGAFAQPYPDNTTRQPTGYQLPFHLDTRTGLGECTQDLNHNWLPQHLCWNNGAMGSFVQTHTSTQFDGPGYGLLTMGYYTRADLPYHYALADAFTICDRYHCSIMGPTHPNRLMALSGTIDPDGRHGGPVLTTEAGSEALFSVNWTTVPELLEDAGVSWKTYTPPFQGYVPGYSEQGFGDAILPYFSQYKRPSSALYKKAFLPTFPNDFAHDVKSGSLPSVSWIIPPNGYDEHPPAPPGNGAWFIDQVLETLVSNKEVWSKTVLFIMYDENDGFFDHVAPPVAPIGTPGEYITVNPLPGVAGGVAGPLGLGFRVPMLVISPFSRGGYVSSDVFDHTSQIRFLEERFGIRSTEISAWRRQAVGNLTSTLRMEHANVVAPHLPSTTKYRSEATTIQGCTEADINEVSGSLPTYPLAAVQTMPTQEMGTIKRLP
jgi:phospholipase C